MKTAQEAGAALRELRMQSGLSGQQVRVKSKVANLTLVERGLASVSDMDLVARALGTTLIKVMHRTHARPTTNLRYLAEAVANLPEGGSKIDRLVDAAVLYALEICDQNQSAAARLLGMERKAFVRRLVKARREAKRKR